MLCECEHNQFLEFTFLALAPSFTAISGGYSHLKTKTDTELGESASRFDLI